MDLDQFWGINGTFGHCWGDALLRQVGNRVRQALRKSNGTARLWGDEFCELLPTVGSLEGGIRIVRRILNALDEPFSIEAQAVRVGPTLTRYYGVPLLRCIRRNTLAWVLPCT